MRYFAVETIILVAIIALPSAAQNNELSQSAFAIFQQNCLVCHGSDGAFRETLLMEHSELIDGGSVVPGSPDTSELYKRLLGPTENGAQMPFAQPPLPPQSVGTIRRWIQAGAPDWNITPPSDRRFIPQGDNLTSIEKHINSLTPFDRPFARYFNFTHLYNAGETADILGEYRKALNKLINSLSWGVTITNPEPIDREQNIYYIDLRRYEWDRNDAWAQIERVYPYHIAFNTQAALRNQLARIQRLTLADKPVINADWFIAIASSPPLYNALLSLPENDRQLEDRLDVDVANNILTAPGIRVIRAGFNNSGVSNHNRVVERHTSRYGAYWKSYDFAGSVGTQNIFTNPLAFTHDGGEIIFNLPNGLQGYYLVDGDGFRLDEAPVGIVSNPAASDPTVRNGLSCIGCHTEGMKEIDDQVRAVIRETANPAYNKNHALRLYVEDDTMDSLVENDTVRYQRALELTGGALGDIEPVSRFHEGFQGSVNAAHAAAAVGLPTESFLEKVRVNAGLQEVGLLVLDSENGTVKRDTWTSNFQDVIQALDYPRGIDDVPVDTQPDLLPGRPVNVPDANLKALLLETLKVDRLNADAMSKLIELNAKNRGISDLTGLEFAINLETLNISENPLTDILPISKCTNLRRFIYWPAGNDEMRDFSPLSNLTKLELLKIRDSNFTDSSFLKRLTNLRELQFYRVDVTDISVLANLTKLEVLTLVIGVSDLSSLKNLTNLTSLNIIGGRGGRITNIEAFRNLTNLTNLELRFNRNNTHSSDISPLARMTKLERLMIFESNLTDISPLKNLTKLEILELHENNITDISSLASLNNLRILNLNHNNISDVLPLSKLLKLEDLHIIHNQVSDFTPITELRKRLHHFHWHDNPGYPSVGYTLTPKLIGEGSSFVLNIDANNLSDLAGWQFDFVFRVNMLEVLEVTEGDFLKSGGGTTFFQGGQIDNTKGTITGIIAGRISEGGVTGSGTLVKIALRAKSQGDTRVTLRNMQFGSANDEILPIDPPSISIGIGARRVAADVNGDGRINILDLIRVAQALGKPVSDNPESDVNGDGIVNIFDLTIVAQKLGGPAAPSMYQSDYQMIESWIAEARLADDGSIVFREGIRNLETLLKSLLPDKSALLANYPNPFNPETWIPYELATSAEVALNIYDMHGGMIRRLDMGHQEAGIYRDKDRAVYWDGRNQKGEPVSSGIYFYTLKAGVFSATRKLLIRK